MASALIAKVQAAKDEAMEASAEVTSQVTSQVAMLKSAEPFDAPVKGPTSYNTSKEWTEGLSGCCSGSCCSCCYSCVCPCCAIGSFRQEFDGSNCIFSACCITPCAYRNFVREGYAIDGSCCGDVLLTVLCYPCSIMQATNEVRSGNRAPRVPAAGSTRAWQTPLCSFSAYGCLCPVCAIASARSAYDDSDCCFNCVCLTPCATRNMIREGYQIDGTCMGDLLCTTFMICCIGSQLYQEVPALGPRISFDPVKGKNKSLMA